METSSEKGVLLSTMRDSVLWLRLNRPASLNALNAALVGELTDAIALATTSLEVRVIVVSGVGRAFCAGADLKETALRSNMPGGNVAFIRATGALVAAIEACPKPVIGAVNGIAMAGGLELLLACDFLIAAESALIGDAHSNYAMFPGAGATVRLPQRIGLAAAKHLMFTGETLTAEAALAIGLIQHCSADAELDSYVGALAAKLAAKSPLVLSRMKEALTDSLSEAPAAALRRERDLNELHSMSFDRSEGLAAFREKRIPQFQNR